MAGPNLIEEFQHAKPPEKAVIIGGVVAVVSIGVYLFMRSKSSASGAATPTDTSTSTGQTAGYPTVGASGTPVLPSGVNPLYDPNGNLIGFQNPPAPGATPTPTPATAPTPANWFSNILGKIGYNATIRPGGFDVNGQRFWIGKTGNSNLFYAPIGSQIVKGAEGRIWLKLPDGTQQRLTGPGLTPSKTVVANPPKIKVQVSS